MTPSFILFLESCSLSGKTRLASLLKFQLRKASSMLNTGQAIKCAKDTTSYHLPAGTGPGEGQC